MQPGLVVRAGNEPQRHFLLWTAPDTPETWDPSPTGTAPHTWGPPQTQQTRVDPGPGHLAQPHLVLVPPVQVPLQDHTGSLPLPQLQEHGGCSREKAEASRCVPAACGARLPPGCRGDSPHSAMNMANSTVPSLSKRWVSWGERRVGLGRPSLPWEDPLGPPPRGRAAAVPPRRKPWRRRRFLRAAGTWGCGRREGTCRRRGPHRSPCWRCRDRVVGGAFLWPLLWPLGGPRPRPPLP